MPVSWNKERSLKRSIEIIENKEHLSLHEATARRHAKKYLIHTLGNTCSICGTSEWINNPVPLVCDHVDGNTANNNIENFRLVCCNCDALLPTYKSKNKKGRHYDKEYHRKRRLAGAAERT